MAPEQFDPDRFARAEKHRLDLEIGGADDRVRLPVLLARGAHPGKRLLVVAGVHGDEFEGVRAIFNLFHEMDPSRMRGDLLAIPVANPPAFWAGTRTSPLDGGDLARTFPGEKQGTATSAIAWALAAHIIPLADFLVDLHSGGIRWRMPLLVGYCDHDPRSRDAAMAFGAPVVWGHPSVGLGRSLTAAEEKGIPWLYTEAPGGGSVDDGALATFQRGLSRLLQHLGILDGRPAALAPRLHLRGEGSLENSILSTQRGLFVPTAQLLQTVTAGDELGYTTDLHGTVIERFHAPQSGVLVLLRGFPVIAPGEPVALVTGLLAEEP